jgi:hypothetical protein
VSWERSIDRLARVRRVILKMIAALASVVDAGLKSRCTLARIRDEIEVMVI